jgi:hypothetical protein
LPCVIVRCFLEHLQVSKLENSMAPIIRPILMFHGMLSQPCALYITVQEAEIIDIVRYAVREAGAEDSLKTVRVKTCS